MVRSPAVVSWLQGLAFGFVLLRVESLAEEGKVRAHGGAGRQGGRRAAQR